MDKDCAICRREISYFKRHYTKDNKVICDKCITRIFTTSFDEKNKKDVEKKLDLIFTGLGKMTLDEAKRDIAVTRLKNEGLSAKSDKFLPKKVIGNLLWIDEVNKLLCSTSGKLLSFDKIMSFELIEEGETVMQGGLGDALIGGALFGGAGAIVGATLSRDSKQMCNSMSIKIILNDISNPSEYINIILSPMKRDSDNFKKAYTEAHECMSTLQIICNRQKETPPLSSEQAISEADEIMKFKNLMDKGIITAEEFEAKKKQLLGL